MNEEKRSIVSYFTPGLLAVIMFAMIFLNQPVFDAEMKSFAVWFVLSAFAFGCGWIINHSLGWNYGSKIIFAIIVANSIISFIFVTFFSEFFGYDGSVVENFLLYALKNVILGSTGIFGMTVSETIALHKEISCIRSKETDEREGRTGVRKEAEIIIEEAKLKSEKMIFETEKKLSDLKSEKNRIETQLKELIKIEKEVLKKYETETE